MVWGVGLMVYDLGLVDKGVSLRRGVYPLSWFQQLRFGRISVSHALNPQPSALSPQPRTLNPEPLLDAVNQHPLFRDRVSKRGRSIKQDR